MSLRQPQAIRRWVIPIMGFSEASGRATGIEKLWQNVRQFSSDTTCVCMPWEWNEDMRNNAASIRRNSDANSRILLVGYSWGGGWAVPYLANELLRVGLDVELAILCDPVFRSPWLPLAPLSLMPNVRIKIPPNVRRVAWVRQIHDIPRAHDLIPMGSELETFIDGPITLDYLHARIDDSPEFQALAASEVARFCVGTTGNAPSDRCHGSEIHNGGPVS